MRKTTNVSKVRIRIRIRPTLATKLDQLANEIGVTRKDLAAHIFSDRIGRVFFKRTVCHTKRRRAV